MTPQHNGTAAPAIRVPDAPITLSTASVYPEKVPSAFEIAALLGYDGVEVMVSTDASSQDLNVLRRLSDYHQVPIRSIHAPCLLLTQRVWGREPWGKLVRSKEVAEELGADVVVVHPPFRWQREYARDFIDGITRMQDETDVRFAVENMFPLKARGAEAGLYAPDWNPVDQPYPHVTLDLSHTAVSKSDALDMATRLGDRLRHVHLADGLGVTNKDEHLVPGRGNQPCGPVLEKLAEDGFGGQIVLEVNTRRASSRAERMEDLAEALAFARLHLAAARGAWEVTSSGEVSRRTSR
ncbi:sugar phosphate isomerase/epimerase [Actinomadura logoneensis]|uniref:Sugar phosphate isomerase/epimerase n=1 Tax=Actinomadura logoneensis TaxID=2293572 RepID=A0A372JNF2_9ACTN|nr:sugar phosphate isomerase/epimerase [Actinomadura logoneensis]RFU41284.1 sugar phosphate isomerase/epimerase [Actinomadura logoneensis]